MKRTLIIIPISILLLMFLSVYPSICGGIVKVSKTNELMPGMSPNEVKNILGEPSQSQFVANKLVWKYKLHEPWKGFVPYYLVFSKGDFKLQEWYADENEYHRQQQLWLQTLPNINKILKK